jgi:hypothetical protein
MPVNDVYRAAIQYSVNGEKCANVLHLIQTSGDGAANVVAELAQQIITDWIPAFVLPLSNDATIQAVTAHKISPAIGGSVVIADSTAGALVNDTIPPNSCVVTSLYSDHLTGRGRGRIYLSGIGKQLVASGRLLNTSPTQFITFLDLLLVTLTGGNGTTFRAGVWSTTGAIFYEYTSYQLRSRLITLRSRRVANP